MKHKKKKWRTIDVLTGFISTNQPGGPCFSQWQVVCEIQRKGDRYRIKKSGKNVKDHPIYADALQALASYNNGDNVPHIIVNETPEVRIVVYSFDHYSYEDVRVQRQSDSLLIGYIVQYQEQHEGLTFEVTDRKDNILMTTKGYYVALSEEEALILQGVEGITLI